MSATITHTVIDTLHLSSGRVIDWPITFTIEVAPRNEGTMQVIVTHEQNGDQPTYRVGHVIGEVTCDSESVKSVAQAEITAYANGELDGLPTEHHLTLNEAIAGLVDFYAAGIDRADSGDPYLSRAHWRGEA